MVNGSHGFGSRVTVPSIGVPMKLIDEQTRQGSFCVTPASVDGVLARYVSHQSNAE